RTSTGTAETLVVTGPRHSMRTACWEVVRAPPLDGLRKLPVRAIAKYWRQSIVHFEVSQGLCQNSCLVLIFLFRPPVISPVHKILCIKIGGVGIHRLHYISTSVGPGRGGSSGLSGQDQLCCDLIRRVLKKVEIAVCGYGSYSACNIGVSF